MSELRLGRALVGHYAVSVAKMGWSGLKNGELLAEAQSQFDVLITGDRNLQFQQNVANRTIAVLVLHAPTTDLADTLPLAPRILALLPTLRAGDVVGVYPE